ncbi:MAG: amidase family protein [Collinsella sp.]
MLGAYLLSSGVYDKYYYAAQKARTLITQDYDAAYAKVDTILMPASPRTAFKFGEISDPRRCTSPTCTPFRSTFAATVVSRCRWPGRGYSAARFCPAGGSGL